MLPTFTFKTSIKKRKVRKQFTLDLISLAGISIEKIFWGDRKRYSGLTFVKLEQKFIKVINNTAHKGRVYKSIKLFQREKRILEHYLVSYLVMNKLVHFLDS